MKNKILELNPAVADPCLNNFSFVVLASFNSHLDMHPMTLYQLSKLGEILPPEKFTCLLKIKEYPKAEFASKYKGLKMLNERFENYLDRELNSDAAIEGLSQVYMCGPTKMSATVLNTLESKKVSHDKYTVI